MESAMLTVANERKRRKNFCVPSRQGESRALRFTRGDLRMDIMASRKNAPFPPKEMNLLGMPHEDNCVL
jgi:hypothetical protein